MLLDDKQYDDALRTLDAKHDDAFAGIYADMRGDILAAAGRNAEARAAYQNALARLDPKSPYRSYVQVKLDAQGGAIPRLALRRGTALAAPASTAPATAACAGHRAGARAPRRARAAAPRAPRRRRPVTSSVQW